MLHNIKTKAISYRYFCHVTMFTTSMLYNKLEKSMFHRTLTPTFQMGVY